MAEIVTKESIIWIVIIYVVESIVNSKIRKIYLCLIFYAYFSVLHVIIEYFLKLFSKFIYQFQVGKTSVVFFPHIECNERPIPV
jgi:hypothetical protein